MSEMDRTVSLKHFWERYAPVVESRLPKHAALRNAVSSAIADGFWARGARFPTETELAQACPYSLGTVQRAMRDLVEDGLVERRRRRGTYVGHRRQLENPWHCRFLDDDGKSFLPVFTRVLSRRTTERQGPWSQPLEQDGQAVIQLDRLMEINSEFTVYSKFYVRADRFPAFLDIPLDDLSGVNLKGLLIETVGRPLTAIREQLRLRQLPRYACRGIDVAEGTIGLHVQATAFAGERLTVYYQELFVPPTERRLYMESSL